MIELSDKTKRVIEILFSEADSNEVRGILQTECADHIPFCENSSPEQMERIRFSALKISNADIQKLKEAVELAKIDWRDLFMAAGFGHDIDAHKNWYALITHQPTR